MNKNLFLFLTILSHYHIILPNSLETLYDNCSTSYETLVQKTKYQVPPWIERKKHIFSTIISILDIGCADGLIGRKLLTYNKDLQITGIDLSQKMVEACRAQDGYQVVIQADVCNGLPSIIKDKKYDVVLVTGCLEFITDHEQLFDSIHQILEPNGLFLFTLQANLEDEAPDDDSVVNIYTEQNAREIITKCGFKIIDWEFNTAGYTRSYDQKKIPYFFIVATLDKVNYLR